jgi:hypothetical protein
VTKKIYAYRYTTEAGEPLLACPDCEGRLDAPCGVNVELVAVSGLATIETSSLDATGRLLDESGSVARGLHGMTECGRCHEPLTEFESEVGEETHGADPQPKAPMTTSPAENAFAQTPGSWTAWYEYGKDGLIAEAGVDNADRSINVCVTTCENVEIDKDDDFNKIVRCDTELLAAGPRLLKCLADLVEELSMQSRVTKPREAARQVLADLRAAGIKI